MATSSETSVAATAAAGDRELVMARLVDAPPARVFEAWTRRLPQWWGPRGMTTPVCEIDARPGGSLHTVMRDSAGKEIPTWGVFLDVAEPNRIVFTDAYVRAWEPSAHPFITGVFTFDPFGDGQTLYTTRVLHWTAADLETHLTKGFYQGWGESLDKFVELLMPSAPGQRELVLTRTFDAPRAAVFRAWTDARRLARWWGPKGFTAPLCEADARPGGSIRIDMRGPDGTVHPMGGEFHEVTENERLVFTSTALNDANGKPALRNLNTVTFVEKDGRTALTLRVRVLTATGAAAAAAVAGMTDGWSQSLDRLPTAITGA